MYKVIYDNYNPLTNETSIVQGDKYRISILTPFLVRFEYSSRGIFEDGQTKMVLNREFPPVKYTLYEEENYLKIITEGLTIKYDKKNFSPYGLSVELNGKVNHPYRGIWHYGDSLNNLGGTARTLDFIDGATELDVGLMSKHGISQIDDSNTPIFDNNGWIVERDSNEIDLYIFGYKDRYHDCLRDYYNLTGSQPKLPKYALGNWWSRYYKYTEQTYIDLMEKFLNQKIPFSVAVIDMDWHLTDVPEKYGSAWTGYTWDRKLFPKPDRFLSKLKEKGLATTLNIHPHSGVRPFEEQYLEMAKSLDVDYKNEEYIDFNPYSEKFLEKSFEFLFYPIEEIGVDFWWIDWQQGPHQLDESIDPLWILNHYHYNDNQKNDNLGITFSRYSGPGSHRYPIGFSGDTVISWKSLDFQPYFTATAANIGYGWWSHDIGGHRHGYRDDELMTRWLQYGVFSPINRLHSADSEFLVKEPWNYREPYRSIMEKYLRLRHQLLPYLYSENVSIYEKKSALILPMYYNHPNSDESYLVPNQYYFGSELVICPMTKPVNNNSLRSSFDAWLPEGEWFDVQTGLKYDGNRNVTLYRNIEQVPVFLKQGGIVPMTNIFELETCNSIANPSNFEIIIGATGSGKYIIYEDELGYEKLKETSQTLLHFDNINKKFHINPAKGNRDAIPERRSWDLKFYGILAETICLEINHQPSDNYEISHNNVKQITSIKIKDVSTEAKVTIAFNKCSEVKWTDTKYPLIYDYLMDAQIENLIKKKLTTYLNQNLPDKILISNILSMELESEIVGPILEIILA